MSTDNVDLPLTPESGKPRIQITAIEEENFREEWIELLEYAFHDKREVFVKDALSGYSDESTWSVRVTSSDGHQQLFVVKIGRKSRIHREYNNAQKAAGGGLYGSPVMPITPVNHPTDDWALIRSTLEGGTEAVTLHDYLINGDGRDINNILEKVFGRPNAWVPRKQGPIEYYEYYDRFLCEHVYVDGLYVDGTVKNATVVNADELMRSVQTLFKQLKSAQIIELRNFFVEKNEKSVESQYTELTLRPSSEPPEKTTFRHKLKYRLTTDQPLPDSENQLVPQLFGQNPRVRYDILLDYAKESIPRINKRSTFKYSGLNFPNPVYHEYVHKLLYKDADPVYVGLTHGDLNLRNILIETANKNEHGQVDTRDNSIDLVWLIDFYHTNNGPVLLDFQWLEVQVIIWLVSPVQHTISANNLIYFFKALHCWENIDLSKKIHTKLQKPYNILRHLRKFAEKFLASSDWSEYYHGLVLCLLGALRFRKLVAKGDLHKEAPKTALLSAAILLNWTNGIVPDGVNIADTLKTPLIKDEIYPVTIESPTSQIILSNEEFMLKGNAKPNSKLQILHENTDVLAETQTDPDGQWQIELSFSECGENSVYIHDVRTKQRSEVTLLTVVSKPYIYDSSIPVNIRSGESFVLKGGASPESSLQVWVDDQHEKTVEVDQYGEWTTRISFDNTGEFNIHVLDEDHDIESLPLVIPVTKKDGLPREILFSLAGALIFFSVLAYIFPPPPSSSERENFRIAVVITTTGTSSKSGLEQEKGAEVAQQFFNSDAQLQENGFGITLDIVNAENTAASACEAFAKQIGGDKEWAKLDQGICRAVNNKQVDDDNKLLAIVGPTYSTQAFAVDALANANRIPVIASSNTARGIPSIGEYISRVSSSVDEQAPYPLSTAYNQNSNIETVAIIHDKDDKFSISEARAFYNYSVKELRLNVTISETFQTGDQSFITQTEKIVNESPDLVIVSALEDEGVKIVKELRENGYEGLIVGGDSLNNPTILDNCEDHCEGMLLAQLYNYQSKNPVNQDFKRIFKDEHKEEAPPQYAALAFTAIQVIVDSLRQIDDESPIAEMEITTLREALNSQIQSGTKFDTPLGSISIDSEGEVTQNKLYTVKIVGEEFVIQ